MSMDQIYLVDSDVFITARNLYYLFDICPGFWNSLLHHHQAGRVYSIDRVRNELLVGSKTEELVQWARGQVPKSSFHPYGRWSDPHRLEDIEPIVGNLDDSMPYVCRSDPALRGNSGEDLEQRCLASPLQADDGGLHACSHSILAPEDNSTPGIRWS